MVPYRFRICLRHHSFTPKTAQFPSLQQPLTTGSSECGAWFGLVVLMTVRRSAVEAVSFDVVVHRGATIPSNLGTGSSYQLQLWYHGQKCRIACPPTRCIKPNGDNV
eukprot:scaffold1771_cov172-Amphora_coffeaeformis.AAC.5